ncbi:hypothetical protein DUI87_19332 [Hirundo rustica rustica]|uniref:Uncharacterized protein n=1 Tax=Hirundo rustica rustica TaxID=333673 RepID=A0A3M0JTD1_HIRRU|nr:hypothetical protein DUI87_19332 [Hirundo rustica rustica]
MPALKRRGEVGVPSTEELFRSSAWSRDSEGIPAQRPESRLECLANPYVGSRVRTCFCDIETYVLSNSFMPDDSSRSFKFFSDVFTDKLSASCIPASASCIVPSMTEPQLGTQPCNEKGRMECGSHFNKYRKTENCFALQLPTLSNLRIHHHQSRFWKVPRNVLMTSTDRLA